MTDQLALFDIPQSGEYEIPTGTPVVRCRSCDAAIIWVQTEKGRAIPLSVATTVLRGDKRYAMTHFADCPHGREWRR